MQSRLFRFITFLFVFTSINREFSPLHIDLRFFIFPLIIFALLLSLTKRNMLRMVHYQVIPPKLPEMWLLLYLSVALLSNIAWLWNGLPLMKQPFYNLIIVFLLNLAMVFLILLNRCNYELDFIRKSIVCSVAFLAISQIAVYLNFPIGLFLSDESVRVLQAGGEHYNLYGQHFRVSGFAEDPNYACFFSALGLVALFSNDPKFTLSKISLAAVFLFSISLSWSRTIIIGSAAIIILMIISQLLSIRVQSVGKALCFAIMSVALIAPFVATILDLDFLQTILTRFELWGRASSLFKSAPLIGSGLSSFRSFNMTEVSGWYVHCHSTFWSALAESGLIGFICFLGSLCSVFEQDENLFSVLAAAVFCLFCFNFDATYLQVTVVVLAIIPAARHSRDKQFVPSHLTRASIRKNNSGVKRAAALPIEGEIKYDRG